MRFVTKEDAPGRTGAGEKEFTGAAASLLLAREDGRRVCWAGLGPGAKVDAPVLRRAAAAAARKLAGLGETSMQFDCTAWTHARDIAGGAVAGAYTFDRYKTSGRRGAELGRLVLVGLDPGLHAAAREGVALAQVLNRVRELGNTPPNILTPAQLAEEARAFAERAGATIRVWDDDALRADGFGGILAVGGGSDKRPRFILLERIVNPAWPTVAIVGKAITFDSGGLAIKPRQGMDEMKYDKMGGLAALGIVESVAALSLPINIVAAVCSAENMLGGGAFRPSDVVTIYGGKTVEVLDTDAEGRVVLADGLSYVRKHYKTDLIVDLATLTGACCVALGLHRTGVFTPDDALADLICEAGVATGDRCWRLPLGEDFADMMKSRIADIANISGSRWGGASTAAAFLQHFVGDAEWVHLDIAGPAYLLEDKPEMERGASGAGLPVVVETLRRRYAEEKAKG